MAGIRIATEEDALAIANIYAPYVRDTAISFEETPPSRLEMQKRLRKTLATHPFLVLEEHEAVVAYAYASHHAERAAYRWAVDVTIYAAPQTHGRGLGRALYSSLLDILAAQGFHAAFAGIALPNQKSIGLHEAMGFHHIGTYPEVGFKLGAWRDVGWWSRPIRTGPPQGEPIGYPELPAQIEA